MLIIGKTRDDAAGEAFDKTARLFGLPFPGGPALERLAAGGNASAVRFPRHRAEPGSLDMSFSGIKTSVRHFLDGDGGATPAADVAASFQAAVVEVLTDRVERALTASRYRAIVLSGGVAANCALQAAFRAIGDKYATPALVPPRAYCTDNAAMIAAAADRRGERGLADALTLSADPNLAF
jgi:N6-L-threonylcarbamoyladenine synthase